MSHKLNLFLGLLALLSLPALSACNTGGGVGDDRQAVGEERGTDSVGEEGTSAEGRSGIIDQQDVGTSSEAGEEEEGTSGQAGQGAEGTAQ